MKKSVLTLRRSIVLTVVIGLLIPAILINGYSWFKLYDSEIKNKTIKLAEENAAMIADSISAALWNLNYQDVSTAIDTVLSKNNNIVRIEARDNKRTPFAIAAHHDRRIGFTASSNINVYHRGQAAGSVSVEVNSLHLQQVMTEGLAYQALLLAVQTGLSILLILILLERRLVRPLLRLNTSAKQLADRKLDEPFTWKHQDEIGALAQGLENTRIHLRSLFSDLDRKNQELLDDIEKRIRIEKVLHERETRMRLLLEQSPLAIIEWSKSRQIIEWNNAAEQIFGYRREEVLGRDARFLSPYVQPTFIDTLTQQPDTKNAQSIHDHLTADGRTITCAWRYTTIDESDGNKGRLLTLVEDITEKRQASSVQQLLEEQKAEADHALLRLAQGTHGITGKSFFESLAHDLASALRADCAFIGLLQKPDHPTRIHTLSAYLHGNTVDNFEYTISGTPCERTLRGHICVFAIDAQSIFPQYKVLNAQGWDSYAGAPLHDANGHTIGVLAVMHSSALRNPDLTRSLLQVFSERASAELERKHAEEELRLSEQRFATIFHSTPVPMFVTQVKNNNVIKDINSAFERLFLRSRSSVIGKNTQDLAMYCNPADRDALLEKLKNTGETASHGEIWMYRGDGTKVLIQLSGHVFLLEGEQFGILACQDVTEKRLIENEILDLNTTLEDRVIERTEELQQANQELETTLDALNLAHEELVNNEKLAALGALVAGISHELNTPIGNSLMVASTLSDQTSALTENYRDNHGIKRSTLESYITDVGKAGDILVRNLHRAADMVNSFKQVAIDQTSSQRRPFSLAEVTSEILLTLWPVIRKNGIVVEQDIPDDISFDSYPGPLGQVLTNLINNALLHGFDGKEQGVVVISARHTIDDWIELSIKDDGIGIPAQNLNRIFDPFFTTKLGAGGSGLGLNIVHNIVSGVLGGRVRVQSAIGIGTTFTLTLPLIAPQRTNDDDALHPQT
ncbi:MAG: PAS domain S-box protein [Pseudomonadota bacterium]